MATPLLPPERGLPKELVGGKYRIEGVIGSGGMGIVVSAVHVRLGERVAIKLLRPETSRHPEGLARCLREARAAIRLRGEHVVRVSLDPTHPSRRSTSVRPSLPSRFEASRSHAGA
jgi:serine/threonine protein kinase